VNARGKKGKREENYRFFKDQMGKGGGKTVKRTKGLAIILDDTRREKGRRGTLVTTGRQKRKKKTTPRRLACLLNDPMVREKGGMWEAQRALCHPQGEKAHRVTAGQATCTSPTSQKGKRGGKPKGKKKVQ